MAINLKCTYEFKKGKETVKLTPDDNPINLTAAEEKRLVSLGVADRVVAKTAKDDPDPGDNTE